MKFTTIYHLFVYSGVEIRKRLRDSLIAWMGGRMAFDALVLLFLREQSSPIQSRIIYSIYRDNSDITHVILSVMRNLVISVMAMGRVYGCITDRALEDHVSSHAALSQQENRCRLRYGIWYEHVTACTCSGWVTDSLHIDLFERIQQDIGRYITHFRCRLHTMYYVLEFALFEVVPEAHKYLTQAKLTSTEFLQMWSYHALHTEAETLDLATTYVQSLRSLSLRSSKPEHPHYITVQ